MGAPPAGGATTRCDRGRPAAGRAREFALGFAIRGSAAALQQLGLAFSAGDRFVVHPALDPRALLDHLRFTINSVLLEELLFRGYLLYRAIRWLGPTRAVLLDAAAFGVYHWFTYGVLGNPIVMAYVFLLTGMYGYMWARVFVATGSVAAPIGLHCGWNAVSYLVFSAGPLGGGRTRPGQRCLATGSRRSSLALNIVLPVLATVAVPWYLRRVEASASKDSGTADVIQARKLS